PSRGGRRAPRRSRRVRARGPDRGRRTGRGLPRRRRGPRRRVRSLRRWEGGMTARVIRRLILKDLALMRGSLACYTLAGTAGLVLAAFPATRGAGVTLALNVLIGVSFHVMLQTVLGERERGTLPFVMSLPVTPGQAAAAKLLSAYLQFAIPGTIAATALVFLSPVDIFHAMAASDRSVVSHAAGWAAYYALVLGAL